MSSQHVSVVKVKDVLLVTLPMDPGDDDMARLQESILKTMELYNAKGVVLDISQVDTLDSYFARVIIETGQMVSLMGGKTVIAGMQVGVAITATQLGLSLGEMENTLDVDRALELLERVKSE